MHRLLPLLILCLPTASPAADMEPVGLSKDKHSLVLADSGRHFTPWGFNYDRDADGRLIEDFWDGEWAKIEKAFADMHEMGANVVRIQLQFGKFMDAADKPNDKQLDRLDKLLELAERERLYLDLTGLGCFHKKDVPAWYDKLSEKERWDAQAQFWQAVAGRCAKSNAVFCYDLMNEPIAPGKKVESADWLAGKLGESYFCQYVTLDPGDRTASEIFRQWIHRLATAIRKQDDRHLITVGMLPFVPDKVSDDLDFLCVHIYPQGKKVDEALGVPPRLRRFRQAGGDRGDVPAELFAGGVCGVRGQVGQGRGGLDRLFLGPDAGRFEGRENDRRCGHAQLAGILPDT